MLFSFSPYHPSSQHFHPFLTNIEIASSLFSFFLYGVQFVLLSKSWDWGLLLHMVSLPEIISLGKYCWLVNI